MLCEFSDILIVAFQFDRMCEKEKQKLENQQKRMVRGRHRNACKESLIEEVEVLRQKLAEKESILLQMKNSLSFESDIGEILVSP